MNLTRYSLFFPEKRDFFLENQGLFNFGSALNFNGTAGDTPIMFYSRRIGLDQGIEIPVEGGGRLTGRVGRYSVGMLNIQSGSADRVGAPSTNFAVARVRRDILRKSAIGAIATRRSSISGGTGTEDLSSFNLDFLPYTISSLTVNDAEAQFTQGQHELVVTPSAPLTNGASFTTVVTYSGSPHTFVSETIPIDIGFHFYGTGDNLGLGLFIVREIVQERPEVQLHGGLGDLR